MRTQISFNQTSSKVILGLTVAVVFATGLPARANDTAPQDLAPAAVSAAPQGPVTGRLDTSHASVQPDDRVGTVDAPAPMRTGISTGLRTLLWTQTSLHSADMFTTVYNLRRSDKAREANPLLAPFSGRPAALVAVSAGVNALQMYTISKVYKRHPKAAIAWALILIGTEAYTVTNNIKVAGELQRVGR